MLTCQTCGREMVDVSKGVPAGTVREEIDCGGDCWGCVSTAEEMAAQLERIDPNDLPK